jgi:two-component system cell cycle response regulator
MERAECDKLDRRIIQALERKIYDLRNLMEVGMSISSNLEFQSLVESILFSCIGQILVERVAIILSDDIEMSSLKLYSATGYERKFEPGEISIPINSPIVRYFEQHHEPCEFLTLVEAGELFEDLKTLEPLEADLIVPIMSRNALNGILLLGGKINGGSFSNDERDFLKGLTRFAAIAIENSRLYHMATIDRMTKLYVHHYFQERMTEEVARSTRYLSPLSFLITDIDHFKNFNDTYGHQVGDMVLKETARIVKESVRVTDFPARYGGEEFAVILPETELDKAIEVAQRLRKKIEAHQFAGWQEPLHVTISIGVAQFDPVRDRIDRQLFIRRADRALYKAKDAGRNCVVASK